MDIAVHFVSLLWDMLRQAHRLGHGAAAVATLAERRKSSLEALVEHCKILVLAVAVLVAGGAGAHSPMWSFFWHHEDCWYCTSCVVKTLLRRRTQMFVVVQTHRDWRTKIAVVQFKHSAASRRRGTRC